MSILFVISFLSDTFTPVLIWKAGLPAQFRWISHTAIALMIIIAFSKVLREGKGRQVLLFISFLTSLGMIVAMANGQGIGPTLWGWWLLFKGPFIGLYAFLFSYLSRHYEVKIIKWCFGLTIVLLIAQLIQYFGGEVPGDNLSGTLGPFGTGHLAIILVFSLSLMCGLWIAKGKKIGVITITVIGIISSVLGEVKLYFYLFPLYTLISLFILIKYKKGIKVWNATVILILITCVMWGFLKLYENVFSEEKLLNWDSISKTTNILRYSEEYGWDVGRSYGTKYVWNRINKNFLTLAFGGGLGSRGESRSFNVAGLGTRSDLINYSGTSLVVILGEYGLFGITLLLIIITWVSIKLCKGAISSKNVEFAGLQFGLLIYTVFSPFLLFYNSAWVMPLPSLLYWSSLGYVLSISRRNQLLIMNHVPHMV